MKNFKEKYEMKQVSSLSKEELLKKIEEEIILPRKRSVRKFGVPEMGEFDSCEGERSRVYELGGLINCQIRAIDQLEDTVVFLIHDEYQVGNEDVAINVDFGVIKSGKIYRNGWITVTDGRYGTWARDDYTKYYIEIKVLETNDKKVILGLKSSYGNVDIYELNVKKDYFSFVERIE
jgi:hypothetical protein